MSKSTLDSEFIAQYKAVELDLASKIPNKDDIKVFKITKNDSIKNKVEAILKFIEEDKVIMLTSLSSGIAKLVAITEIAKQKQPQLYQFNKLLKLNSTTNPNYKNNEKDRQEKKDSEQQVLEEINGPKVYTLPAMYIILTKMTAIEGVDLITWTKQEIK